MKTSSAQHARYLVITAIVSIQAIVGCPSQTPKATWNNNGLEAVNVRHQYRSQVNGKWKAEVWLLGSALRINHGVGVSFRVTPPDKTAEPPGTKVKLRIQKGNTLIAETEYEPVIKDCAKIQQGNEQSRIDGVDGPLMPFPPCDRCWQADNSTHFVSKITVPGKYKISVEIAVVGGPVFRFDEIEISYLGPGD